MIDKGILKALREKSGLSRSRVYSLIKEKQKSLGFAVTRDQAAILVAGERGVDISRLVAPEVLQSIGKFVVTPAPPLPGTPLGETAPVSTAANVQSKQMVSRAIESVLSKARRLQIPNIDQNWVDAVAILNFTETAASKFLSEHGYTEKDIKRMYWDEKIDRVKDKLFEEAKQIGSRPRTSVLSVIKSYREQRNEVDHQAHFPGAQIQRYEIDLLIKTLDAFAKQVFDEHNKRCPLKTA